MVWTRTIDGSEKVARRAGDDKVDPAQCSDGLLDGRLEGFELPHVGLDAETLLPGRLGQLGGGVLDVGFATAEDDGGCAVCGGKTLLALERVQRRPG